MLNPESALFPMAPASLCLFIFLDWLRQLGTQSIKCIFLGYASSRHITRVRVESLPKSEFISSPMIRCRRFLETICNGFGR